MRNLLVYGSGELAQLMAYYFSSSKEFNLISYCVDKQYFKTPVVNGRECHIIDNITEKFSPADTEIFVAAGYSSMRTRELMFLNAERLGYSFASFYSPNAFVDGSVKIGRNAVIMPGVQIEPNVVIGDNCIFWSSSVICHDANVGAHCFLAAQSLVGGRSSIGRCSFLGFNSTILHDVTVGDECLIGAKALVTNSVPSQSKCLGIPAKIVDVIGNEGIRVK